MRKLIDWKLIEINENKEYIQLPNSILNSRIFLKKYIQYAYKISPELSNKLKVNDWIEYIYGSNTIVYLLEIYFHRLKIVIERNCMMFYYLINIIKLNIVII